MNRFERVGLNLDYVFLVLFEVFLELVILWISPKKTVGIYLELDFVDHVLALDAFLGGEVVFDQEL